MQSRAARRLVHAPAFHSNKTVLHNINAANAMFTAKFVQSFQHLSGDILEELAPPDTPMQLP